MLIFKFQTFPYSQLLNGEYLWQHLGAMSFVLSHCNDQDLAGISSDFLQPFTWTQE